MSARTITVFALQTIHDLVLTSHFTPLPPVSWNLNKLFMAEGMLYYDIYIYINIYIYKYIYIYNCNWVDTRWQQYITHLHTNNTQNTEKGEFGKCWPCPVFASYTLAFALLLMK
jgi:hypothetical protein